MAFNATPGDPAANSYIDVATATAWFSDRILYHPEWAAASLAQQEAALIQATERIDMQRFVGYLSTPSQRLKWPRAWVTNEDGYWYDSTTVPRIVQDATCELAILILKGDYLAETKLRNINLLKIGSLQITPRQPQTSGKLPAQVTRLLYRVMIGGPGSAPLLRT